MCDLSPRKWDYDHLQSFFVSYRVLPGPCFRSFRLPFLTHPNHRQMLTCLHTRYIRITYPCTWTLILEFKGSTLAEIKCARESVWWIVEFDNLDQNLRNLTKIGEIFIKMKKSFEANFSLNLTCQMHQMTLARIHTSWILKLNVHRAPGRLSVSGATYIFSGKTA